MKNEKKGFEKGCELVMTKIIKSMAVLLFISVIANICFIIMLLTNDTTSTTIKEIDKSVPGEVEIQDPSVIQTDSISSYTEPAILYIKTTKTGKSTDLYLDRLKDVKDILSQEIYEKLTPDMSDDEIEEAKKHAADTDPSLVSATSILDTDVAYKKTQNDTYDIYIIYTMQTDRNAISSTQRYLCRLEVKSSNDKYLITNIFEDSILENGVY